jgi:type I restriction enzyme M protein
MRTFDRRTGEPQFVDLADFPAPDETLDELESAERRPLRIAAGDSLVRTFRRCHDYLYGNQSMRGDRAFWQLLYLIFAKILDERQSKRLFFVGATEGNTPAGQRRVTERITSLFELVKKEYDDVFEGGEKLELTASALTFIAGELGRYSLLSTDTDAKGTAYESITSTTLKRERGQFFTPRNVIRMMVEMANPGPDARVLDPACGSGGFLVVALAHVRRRFLAELGCPDPDHPLPSELKKLDGRLRKYAQNCLYGIDVDPELRKAARMNMVMNNDGHGNIFSFNSLAYGNPESVGAEGRAFEARGGGEGKFDFVFTNPPFGAKIPVSDPEILRKYDLGYPWEKVAHGWQRLPEPHRKVSPEILFIERCARFLRPGTGVMGIVTPNGILGNPGTQMEFVRWWMLREMELLASVDLPAETFLPQVSVQASCVFLRRRHKDELRLAGQSGLKQSPVFMAIADRCGHGRRGETTWEREPDGTERVITRDLLERMERDGRIVETRRTKQMRVVADDMPWVAEQYREFLVGKLGKGA